MGYMQEARENHVKKKVEEALRSKMKQKALKECDEYTSKYAQCAAGKTLSIVWQCRKQAKELNDCLHQLLKEKLHKNGLEMEPGNKLTTYNEKYVHRSSAQQVADIDFEGLKP
ncbi:hypothetical protein Gotur_000826 [Gossypium turneri]